MGWLDRIFGRRVTDLSLVDGITRVRADCVVASPATTVSPVTGLAASLLRWTLLESISVPTGRGGGTVTRFRLIVSGLYDESLLLGPRPLVAVPLRGARLFLHEDPEDGTLMMRIPAVLADVVAAHRRAGSLAYREAALLPGDRVRLTATLAPAAAPGHRSPYREAGPVDLVALPERERIVIEEL